jgi:hypothetical protein
MSYKTLNERPQYHASHKESFWNILAEDRFWKETLLIVMDYLYQRIC